MSAFILRVHFTPIKALHIYRMEPSKLKGITIKGKGIIDGQGSV